MYRSDIDPEFETATPMLKNARHILPPLCNYGGQFAPNPASTMTFHPATVLSYPFHISLFPSILQCVWIHQGKCQWTHLTIGLADPFQTGYTYSPRWARKPREIENQSGWTVDTCSWQVTQAWSTWVMKPSGSWPTLPNPGHTCWACKTTLEQ